MLVQGAPEEAPEVTANRKRPSQQLQLQDIHSSIFYASFCIFDKCHQSYALEFYDLGNVLFLFLLQHKQPENHAAYITSLLGHARGEWSLVIKPEVSYKPG